jgi:hypothetical protein
MHKFTKHHCGGKEEVINVIWIVFRQPSVCGFVQAVYLRYNFSLMM